MKISMDVDGDGEDDVKVELSERIGRRVVVIIAALASACLGGNFLVQ